MEGFILAAFVIGFPSLWVAVSLLLSRVGGWAQLAERYPVTSPCEGPTFYMQSGSVGLVNYKSCLTLRICATGLRLSVLFPFRVGHPPILIPWKEFHSTAEKRVFFYSFLDAYVGMPVVAHMALPIWIRDYIPTDSKSPVATK
jgi:hypothetical protein